LQTEGKPDLRNICPEDIKRLSRLRELYRQATEAGWIERSEPAFLNFAAAAARATRVAGDPVRIFVGIVRRGLWHHITQEQEERAAAVIRRERERKATPGVAIGIDLSSLLKSMCPTTCAVAAGRESGGVHTRRSGSPVRPQDTECACMQTA
jgi:hypothetical protein